jgi:hypothetical protein
MRVGLGLAVFLLEIEDQRHQRFGDIAPAERPKWPRSSGWLRKLLGWPCRFCAHERRLAEAARLVQIASFARAFHHGARTALWPLVDLDGVRVGLHDFVLTFILRKDAVAREALQRREGGLERGRLFIFDIRK